MADIQTTTEILKVYPAIADFIDLGTTTTAYSSWTPLNTDIGSTKWNLAGATFFCTTSINLYFEIGVGAAGFEEVIARVMVDQAGSSGDSNYHNFGAIINAIPANARVSARWKRESGTSGTAQIALHYYEGDLSSDVATITSDLEVAPVTFTDITPDAVAWTWSTYVEVSSSLTDALVLGANLERGQMYAGEIELAIGAGGSEVTIAALPFNFHANLGQCLPLLLAIPRFVSGADLVHLC